MYLENTKNILRSLYSSYNLAVRLEKCGVKKATPVKNGLKISIAQTVSDSMFN